MMGYLRILFVNLVLLAPLASAVPTFHDQQKKQGTNESDRYGTDLEPSGHGKGAGLAVRGHGKGAALVAISTHGKGAAPILAINESGATHGKGGNRAVDALIDIEIHGKGP